MEGNIYYCGEQTLAGHPCRQQVQEVDTKCWQHAGPQCSICFTCMNGRRQDRTLPCNHCFHTKCIDRWKITCGNKTSTCPICRTEFDVPLFKCRLIIEKVQDGTIAIANFQVSNLHSIINNFGIELNRPLENNLEIFFDIDEGENINTILEGLNLPLHPSPN